MCNFDVAWLLQCEQYRARNVIGIEALLEAVVKVFCLLRIAEAAGLDWSAVTITVADERAVPAASDERNWRVVERLVDPLLAAGLVGVLASLDATVAVDAEVRRWVPGYDHPRPGRAVSTGSARADGTPGTSEALVGEPTRASTVVG